MTDHEDSSMPEKTLRKRKETKHLSLPLCLVCVNVYLCVHVCVGTMPQHAIEIHFCGCPITHS